MVVPAVSVGVFLNSRLLFQGLEADNIGLRWGISEDRVLAVEVSSKCLRDQIVSRCKSEVQLLAIGGSHSAVS